MKTYQRKGIFIVYVLLHVCITAIYVINASSCGPDGSSYSRTHTHTANMDHFSQSLNVFLKMTPEFQAFRLSVWKSNSVAKGTFSADSEDIILTKGQLLTYMGERSLPCLQPRKKSTDGRDTGSHPVVVTAALTDVSPRDLSGVVEYWVSWDVHVVSIHLWSLVKSWNISGPRGQSLLMWVKQWKLQQSSFLSFLINIMFPNGKKKKSTWGRCRACIHCLNSELSLWVMTEGGSDS